MDTLTTLQNASEKPMCRICHEGGAQEELLSPCECSGTLATIHRSCLERWLSASRTSSCELCHHQFTLQRRSRRVMAVSTRPPPTGFTLVLLLWALTVLLLLCPVQWLQCPGQRREKLTLLGDMMCFLFISPLATVCGWLCLRCAIDHLHFSSWMEAFGLLTLSVALFTIYLFWTLVSIKYHCQRYHEWRQSDQGVVVLLPAAPGAATVWRSFHNSQELAKESMV